MELENGSTIAVIGGGPAGSMSAYFLLGMAEMAGLDLTVQIFESKTFCETGPSGCNMCGGVISESLVQMLSAEGIQIPDSVIVGAIDAYILHTQAGSVTVEAPVAESRIAAIYRGGGPRGCMSHAPASWSSFDAFLLDLATQRGAEIIPHRVTQLSWDQHRPRLHWSEGEETYDLLVGATGLNGAGIKLFQDLDFGYAPPRTAKSFIADYYYGEKEARHYLKNAMHIFLLEIPGLEFAALTPKGPYATLIILGEKIDKELIDRVEQAPEVRALFPTAWKEGVSPCRCQPRIYLGASRNPFTDRVALVGDCFSSRLYKDGIGAAYQGAKALAATAIFHGISRQAFEAHYQPVRKRLDDDNALGMKVFGLVRLMRRFHAITRGILRTVEWEQRLSPAYRRLSSSLWDTFTGSAAYRDIFRRLMTPGLILTLTWETLKGAFKFPGKLLPDRQRMPVSVLAWESTPQMGKLMKDGDVLFTQGEKSPSMFVILEGRVEILHAEDEGDVPVRVAIMEKDNVFGTQALFDELRRTYTARALGDARVLTLDKAGFLKRVTEDPSLALRIIMKMSERVRELHSGIAHMHKNENREKS